MFMAAVTATIALTLPVLSIVGAAARRLGTLHPSLPGSRMSGIIVLCASLSTLGRDPARAAVPPPIARDVAPAPSKGAPAQAKTLSGYVVKPGDSLWAIACRFLSSGGAEPSEAEIERMWRAIYATNRDVIGPNPDLIYPGTTLTIPEERA